VKRIVLAFSCVLAAGVIASSAVSASPPRTQLRSLQCVTALDPPSRAISITAVMRPVSSTSKMQLRFQLYSRPNSSRPYSRVHGGDLNTWVTPNDPTLGQRSADVWTLIKQVVDLKAPATYRFRVYYRWLGSHGQVLGSTVRTSQTCYQPELRPDLQVRTVHVEAVTGNASQNEYVAVIRNAGATAAGPFEVQFIDGQLVKTRSLSGLAAHTTIRERFIGPVCASGTATVTADPVDAVDDFNRTNNSLHVTCSETTNTSLHSRVR
jgi:hypothetical protein